MAGVHRLDHIQRFRPTTLTHDNTVGPHSQCVLHQITNGVRAGTFHIGRLALHRHHMLLVQTQLDGVFDRDDPLFVRNEAAEHV